MKEIIYLLFVFLSLSGYSQSKKHKKTRAQKTVLNASLVKDSLGVKNSAFSKIEFLEPEKFKIDSIAAQLKKYSESKKNTDYLASKKKKKKSKKDNSWFQSQFQKNMFDQQQSHHNQVMQQQIQRAQQNMMRIP